MSAAHDCIVDALREASWLDSHHKLDRFPDGDLLPAVAAVCGSAAQRSWINLQVSRGAQMQMLDSRDGVASDWVGQRLLFTPQPPSTGQLIGLASSRLGRRLDTQRAWFTVFRAACSKIDRAREILFTAESTTTARFVERAADLFDVPVLALVTARTDTSIRKWLEGLTRLEASDSNVRRAYLSPPFGDLEPMNDVGSLPLRDRAVVAMSDRLLVFHLRRGGQLDALVRARLNDQRFPRVSVFIALGDGLVERRLADELLDCGAVGWVVLDTRAVEPDEQDRIQQTGTLAAIVPLPSAQDWPFLTHCTRDQRGAWPDQSDAEFVDELLLKSSSQSRSAVDALERIIATERLVATSQLVRGDVPVVSFTAVPLAELPQMRAFRSHLGRWDFEPYGIAVRRGWLESRRARAVRYGDEALWNSLAIDQQPFFQNNDGQLEVDWSLEREWRHVGDVDLTDLSSDDAVIFVPSDVEAQRVAAISRWPVTVLASR